MRRRHAFAPDVRDEDVHRSALAFMNQDGRFAIASLPGAHVAVGDVLVLAKHPFFVLRELDKTAYLAFHPANGMCPNTHLPGARFWEVTTD